MEFKYRTNDGKEVLEFIEKYYEQSGTKGKSNSGKGNKK